MVALPIILHWTYHISIRNGKCKLFFSAQIHAMMYWIGGHKRRISENKLFVVAVNTMFSIQTIIPFVLHQLKCLSYCNLIWLKTSNKCLWRTPTCTTSTICTLIVNIIYFKFEDVKGVIRSHKLKKDRYYNSQKNKDKRTNNDL